jgi:hypothetical protein
MSELRRLVLAFLGIVVMMLAGCAVGYNGLEVDYSQSVRFAVSSQILDPAAQQNLTPVYSFDGRAAAATVERYQTSFEKPPPPPAFVISVGQTR